MVGDMNLVWCLWKREANLSENGKSRVRYRSHVLHLATSAENDQHRNTTVYICGVSFPFPCERNSILSGHGLSQCQCFLKKIKPRYLLYSVSEVIPNISRVDCMYIHTYIHACMHAYPDRHVNTFPTRSEQKRRKNKKERRGIFFFFFLKPSSNYEGGKGSVHLSVHFVTVVTLRGTSLGSLFYHPFFFLENY